MLAGGVGLRRAEPLGEADEHDPGRRPGGAEVVVDPDAVGQPERRQAAGDVADDLDALVGEVEELDDDDAEDDGDERAGDDRREAAQPEDDAPATARPTSSVRPCVSPRWVITPHSCSKKSPSSFSMPNSFGTWPMMMVRARPMMKPLSTGSEMKLARNPRRSSPAPSASTPVIRASTPVNASTSSGPPVVRSATAAADSAAVADIGPTMRWRELPNAA